MFTVKSFLKSLFPPFLFSMYRKCFGNGIKWLGRYKSWSEAEASSSGYDESVVFEQVKRSTLNVINGLAVAERDGVNFTAPQYDYPLIAAILRQSSIDNGHLSVLDFGGALGSMYWNYRPLLSKIENWVVVEQKHFVDYGRQHIAKSPLFFAYDIESAIVDSRGGFNVLMFGSVLQYLQKPFEVLESCLKHQVPTVILDRTTFSDTDETLLTVQHVPESIAKSSYPCWLFDQAEIVRLFANYGYKMLCRFDDPHIHDQVISEGIVFVLDEAH